MREERLVDWTPDDMVEITLPDDEMFLQVKETLERIGIANFREKKLYQSCHILQKRGRYYIVHFKEMFALDGKKSHITEEDMYRRNHIASLLQDWGLVTLVRPVEVLEGEERVKVFVLKHSEKQDWEQISKYTIGGNH